MILQKTFFNIFYIAFALAVFLLVGFFVANVAHAQTYVLQGAAWSDMPNGSDEVIQGGGQNGRGAGWISMSGPGYQVAWNSSTGLLSGQAWSEHIGWVQFGSLSGCPSGNCQSRIAPSTGQAIGWARALAGTQDPNDDWDGWISLSRLNGSPQYGVKLAYDSVTGQGSFSGQAWGDNVLGWIDFSRVTINGTPPPTEGLTLVAGDVCPDTPTTTISWGDNSGTTYTSCTATSTPPTAWDGYAPSLPASLLASTTAKVVAPSTSYTLSCVDSDGVTHTQTATAKHDVNLCTEDIPDDPSLDLSASTNAVCPQGNPKVTLSFYSPDSTDFAGQNWTCVTSSNANTLWNNYGAGYSAPLELPLPSETIYDVPNVEVPNSQTEYTLFCENADRSASITVKEVVEHDLDLCSGGTGDDDDGGNGIFRWEEI